MDLVHAIVAQIGLQVVANPLFAVEFPTDTITVGLVRDLADIEKLRAAVEGLRQQIAVRNHQRERRPTADADRRGREHRGCPADAASDVVRGFGLRASRVVLCEGRADAITRLLRVVGCGRDTDAGENSHGAHAAEFGTFDLGDRRTGGWRAVSNGCVDGRGAFRANDDTLLHLQLRVLFEQPSLRVRIHVGNVAHVLR